MGLYLIIEDGEDRERVRLSREALILGRSPKCHISLNYPAISGNHLAIKISKGGKVVAKDLGSTNGTLLNGNKAEEFYLRVEDQVQIGPVQIRLDPKGMSKEKRYLHSSDTNKTTISYVKLKPKNNQISDDTDTADQFTKKPLLTKIREQKSRSIERKEEEKLRQTNDEEEKPRQTNDEEENENVELHSDDSSQDSMPDFFQDKEQPIIIKLDLDDSSKEDNLAKENLSKVNSSEDAPEENEQEDNDFSDELSPESSEEEHEFDDELTDEEEKTEVDNFLNEDTNDNVNFLQTLLNIFKK